MFSQYSWGDFIKFILALVIPYYAFVVWKFYRVDIREWISNRGATSSPAPVEVTDEVEDEIEDTGLYAVKTYSDNTPVEVPDSKNSIQTPASTPKLPARETEPVITSIPDQQSVDISEGVVLSDEVENTFEIGLAAEVVRPEERSLAQVINAAHRVAANDKGALSANDPSDTEAVELANAINEQKGFSSVLSGVPFTR